VLVDLNFAFVDLVYSHGLFPEGLEDAPRRLLLLDDGVAGSAELDGDLEVAEQPDGQLLLELAETQRGERGQHLEALLGRHRDRQRLEGEVALLLETDLQRQVLAHVGHRELHFPAVVHRALAEVEQVLAELEVGQEPLSRQVHHERLLVRQLEKNRVVVLLHPHLDPRLLGVEKQDDVLRVFF